MKKFSLPIAAGVGVLTFAISLPDSHAVFGIFKKKNKPVPSESEFDQMSAQADAALASAEARDQKDAYKIYKSIVDDYPLTKAAATAQFKIGEIQERQGDLWDAFKSYQEFITQYRGSALFQEALDRQFAIAEKARSGAKDDFLVFKRKFQDSRVIEMYEGIINNAPFGKLAPIAQFNIAEIHQANGDKAKAVLNYQIVVDTYENAGDLKEEAIFRIGAINNTAARFSENTASIQEAKDYLQIYNERNPDGERAEDASAILKVLDERQAENDFEIAQFYDKRGNYRAAMIYYNDLAQYSDFKNYDKVVQRIDEISAKHPEALAIPGAPVAIDSGSGETVLAGTTKARKDYVGPPAPDLVALTKKPKMRADDDIVPLGPIEEPDLPGGAGVSVENPLLPAPPSPDTSPLVIPPPPEDAVIIPPIPGDTPDTTDPAVPTVTPTVPDITSPPDITVPSVPGITDTKPTPPTLDLDPKPTAPSLEIPKTGEEKDDSKEEESEPEAVPTVPVVPPIPDLPESP